MVRCFTTNSSRSCGRNLRRHGTWGVRGHEKSVSLLPVPQEIQRVLAILRAAFDGAGAGAAGAAAAAASVVAVVGGGAERGTVVGTAAVAVPGGNPEQAAAVAVVTRAGVATRVVLLLLVRLLAVLGRVRGSVERDVPRRMRRRQVLLLPDLSCWAKPPGP